MGCRYDYTALNSVLVDVDKLRSLAELSTQTFDLTQLQGEMFAAAMTDLDVGTLLAREALVGRNLGRGVVGALGGVGVLC